MPCGEAECGNGGGDVAAEGRSGRREASGAPCWSKRQYFHVFPSTRPPGDGCRVLSLYFCLFVAVLVFPDGGSVGGCGDVGEGAGCCNSVRS